MARSLQENSLTTSGKVQAKWFTPMMTDYLLAMTVFIPKTQRVEKVSFSIGTGTIILETSKIISQTDSGGSFLFPMTRRIHSNAMKEGSIAGTSVAQAKWCLETGTPTRAAGATTCLMGSANIGRILLSASVTNLCLSVGAGPSKIRSGMKGSGQMGL